MSFFVQPDGHPLEGTQLTIKPQGRFSGVCMWSDGKGFFGPVAYEGTWQIKADRLVLDTTVWNAERQEPWPDHEEYIMTDGVLLLADFGAQREGTPYYKKR